MDLPSRERWYDYSRARDKMLAATDTDFAPWHIVRSDDKKRARLNVLSHFLSLIPYEAPKRDKIKLPTRNNENAYDDEATMQGPALDRGEILTRAKAHAHFRVMPTSPGMPPGKSMIWTLSLYPSGRSCRCQNSYISLGRPVSVDSQPGSC